MTNPKPRIKATKTELLEQLNFTLQQNEFLRQNSYLSRAGLASALGQSFDGARDLYEVLGYKRELVYGDFLNIYERDGLGTRIVDSVSDETWRVHPVLLEKEQKESDENAEPGPLQTAFSELANQHDLWAEMNEADRMCGISRFSVLYLGLPGRSEDPVKPGKSNNLAYVTAHDEGSATVDELSLDTDPESPRFGLPELYKIALNEPTTLEILVHHSRVIHIKEGRDRRNYPRIYGVPRLKNIINRLWDLEKVLGGGSEAFWKLIYQGVVLKLREGFTFPPKDSQEYKDTQDEWDEWEHGLRRVVRAQGLDPEFLGGKPVDSREQFDVVIEYIAGSKRIPQRILLGSERGNLASTQDDAAFMDYIAWRQVNFAEPYILRPFVEKMGELGILDVPEGWHVDWPSLFQLNDIEEADIAVKIAQAINTGSGGAPDTIIPAEEFARRLPGKWNFVWTDALKREQAAEEEKARSNTPPSPFGSNGNGQGGNGQNPPVDVSQIDVSQMRRALMVKALQANQLNTPFGPVLLHNENENSAMVAFRIPDNLRTELQNTYPFMDDETRDNLHVTLAFLGDSRSLDMDKAELAVAEFAVSARPIKTKLQGLARFVSGAEKDPIVVTLDSPDLPEFRETLRERLDRYGIPYAKDHGFIPHMTLGYIKADAPLPIETIEPMEINFSEIYLVDRGQWVQIVLGANPENGETHNLMSI